MSCHSIQGVKHLFSGCTKFNLYTNKNRKKHVFYLCNFDFLHFAFSTEMKLTKKIVPVSKDPKSVVEPKGKSSWNDSKPHHTEQPAVWRKAQRWWSRHHSPTFSSGTPEAYTQSHIAMENSNGSYQRPHCKAETAFKEDCEKITEFSLLKSETLYDHPVRSTFEGRFSITPVAIKKTQQRPVLSRTLFQVSFQHSSGCISTQIAM